LQRPDGSFRSEHYAVLRSGQAMTPFVLHALQAAGEGRGESAAKALEFVRKSIGTAPSGEGGAIGYGDPDLLEYPVYATSLAILVLKINGDAADSQHIADMAEWLAAQQCGEPRGFQRGAPAYGAFGFGALGLPPGVPGHVDITHTRFALQALRAAGRLDDAVREPALILLGNLQQPDGGFSFSPVVIEANKAGRDEDGRFRSYATATADGVLALRALGVREDDRRLLMALDWLSRNASADHVGGIDPNPPEPWHDALRFYHAMALAEAFPPAREGLSAMLIARQRDDGSFASDLSSAMKEDDPLLATSLALRSLSAR
jgi:hypothetical protein